jgi:phosphate starvation-inducible PhoH-like protein
LSRKPKRSWNEAKTNDKIHSNSNAINFNEYKKFNKKIELIPRNRRQEDYIYNLLSPDLSIVFATGPAGTGKTMLAVLSAIKALKEGDVKKIVVTRPAVGVDGEKHGFLPGDLNQKMEPWTRPIFDVLH